MASAAVAGPLGQTGSFAWTRVNGYYTGSGGEFTVGSYTGLSNASYVDTGANLTSTRNIDTALTGEFSFQSFCLEVGESAVSPSYFVVASGAIRSGAASADPLSLGTAWLYSQFAQGILNVPLVNSFGNYFSDPTPPVPRPGGRVAAAGNLVARR